MYDIHVLTAIAEATENNGKYACGERHALMIFSRQPSGEASNYELAAENVYLSGWDKFEFAEALVLEATKGERLQDEILVEAFSSAVVNGCAVIAHAESIDDEAP